MRLKKKFIQKNYKTALKKLHFNLNLKYGTLIINIVLSVILYCAIIYLHILTNEQIYLIYINIHENILKLFFSDRLPIPDIEVQVPITLKDVEVIPPVLEKPEVVLDLPKEKELPAWAYSVLRVVGTILVCHTTVFLIEQSLCLLLVCLKDGLE